jgi:Putative zinc-finger
MAELGNYLDGEVAEEIRVQLENHISHCRSCTVLVDSTRKTLKIVTETGSFDLPQSVFKPVQDKIMARVRETQK